MSKNTFNLIFIFVICMVFSYAVSHDQKNRVNDGFGEGVLVAAGEFEMGDSFNEGNSDEIPVHIVYLDAYYIGKYKVTNEEYLKFIKEGGYSDADFWTAGGFGRFGQKPAHWDEKKYKGGGIPGNENYPVVGVSWYEAVAYCNWLSKKTGKIYRLPTG